jgi:hypothetical protein
MLDCNPAHTHNFLTDDDNGGGRYGIGFYLGNDEVGSGSIRLHALIWRLICSNGIVLVSEDKDNSLRLPHLKNRVAMMAEIKMMLAQMLPVAADALERIYEAEVEHLPSIGDIVRGLSADNNWTDQVRDAVLIGTEGQSTRMGLVNGVTAAAHTQFADNAQRQFELEALGGRLLFADARELQRYSRVAVPVN